MFAFKRHHMNKISNWWWTVDKTSFFLTLLLIFIGVMLVLSASPSAAHRDRLSDEFSFVKKQIIFVCAGVVILTVVSMQSLRNIRRLAVLGFFCAFLGILLTYVVGDATKGASRWIKFAGFSLQPSEFIKPMLIVVTAWLLDAGKKHEEIPGKLLSGGLCAITAAAVLAQPDLGMTILIGAAFSAQIFLAGITLKWILIGFISLGVVLPGLAYVFLAHVRDRIGVFLAKENEIGSQIQKSLDAFASGNLLGRGPGEGVVKMSLPDVHTDFIFSLAGEEGGVWLTSLIVLIFMVIAIRSLYRVMNDKNLFVMYAGGGLVVSICGQSVVNMCSVLELAPAKGSALPFVSYGGSSMLASSILMGMLLAITRRNASALEKDGI